MSVCQKNATKINIWGTKVDVKYMGHSKKMHVDLYNRKMKTCS